MESLPAGMVASALQSRIDYLTKHVENLPAKCRQTEVIRVPGFVWQWSGCNARKKAAPKGAARIAEFSTPLELNLKFKLQHASGYRRSLEVSVWAAGRRYRALNMPESTSIGQIVVGVREAWMV